MENPTSPTASGPIVTNEDGIIGPDSLDENIENQNNLRLSTTSIEVTPVTETASLPFINTNTGSEKYRKSLRLSSEQIVRNFLNYYLI